MARGEDVGPDTQLSKLKIVLISNPRFPSSCNLSVVTVSLHRLQWDLQDVEHVHERIGEMLHHRVIM